MKTVKIELADDLAEKLNRVSKEKRDLLLKIWIDRITSSGSLSDLLEFSAIQAQKQGLTDEDLKELLKDE